MSGGIIIQRAGILIPALNHPSYYPYLHTHEKDCVDAATAKGAGACTQADIEQLSKIQHDVTCRG